MTVLMFKIKLYSNKLWLSYRGLTVEICNIIVILKNALANKVRHKKCNTITKVSKKQAGSDKTFTNFNNHNMVMKYKFLSLVAKATNLKEKRYTICNSAIRFPLFLYSTNRNLWKEFYIETSKKFNCQALPKCYSFWSRF